MSSSPSVSILIPLCGVSGNIEQCMDSVVNQTLKNIEIICINDETIDDSVEMLESYASKDQRIKIINKKNASYEKSLNIAIDNATGEYIGIVESNGFIELNMFEKLYGEAIKDNLDVSRCNFYIYTSERDKVVKSNLGWVKHNKVYAPNEEFAVFYQQPSVWANIYKTKFIRENDIRFLETSKVNRQGISFTFKVYSLATRFKIIQDALVHHRVENSKHFSNEIKTNACCVFDEFDEIKRYTKQNSIYEKYRKLIAHLQYVEFNQNNERLTESQDQELFKRWTKEFTIEYDQGNIDRNLFSYKEYDDVLSMISRGTRSIDAKNPKVSVIIPIYNKEKYLRQCLDSVLSQNLKEIHIVCINDGSTDGSTEILSEYAEKDKRVKILNQPNSGVSYSRNRGIAYSTSEFITFMDPDDYYPSDNTLGILYMSAKINNVSIAGGSWSEEIEGKILTKFEGRNSLYVFHKDGLMRYSDYQFDYGFHRFIYSRKMIRDNKIVFPSYVRFQDTSFFIKAMIASDTFYALKTPTYRYRFGHQSFTWTNKMCRDVLLGLIDNLRISSKNKLVTLHETTLSRINDEYGPVFVNIIQTGLYDPYLIELLIRANTAVDRNLLKNSNFTEGDSYCIKPLKDLIQFYNSSFYLNNISNKEVLGISIHNFKNITENSEMWLDSLDFSDSIATMKWVHDYERTSNIDRWRIIFDSNNEGLNWGYPDGIKGGKTLRPKELDSIYAQGHRVRFFVSYNNMNTVCMMGEFYDFGRMLCGTTLSDGKTVILVSVDVDLKNESIAVYGYDLNKNKDISKLCSLMKVQITW